MIFRDRERLKWIARAWAFGDRLGTAKDEAYEAGRSTTIWSASSCRCSIRIRTPMPASCELRSQLTDPSSIHNAWFRSIWPMRGSGRSHQNLHWMRARIGLLRADPTRIRIVRAAEPKAITIAAKGRLAGESVEALDTGVFPKNVKTHLPAACRGREEE